MLYSEICGNGRRSALSDSAPAAAPSEVAAQASAQALGGVLWWPDGRCAVCGLLAVMEAAEALGLVLVSVVVVVVVSVVKVVIGLWVAGTWATSTG